MMTLEQAFNEFLVMKEAGVMPNTNHIEQWQQIYRSMPKHEILAVCERHIKQETFFDFISCVFGFFFATHLYNHANSFSEYNLVLHENFHLQRKIDQMREEKQLVQAALQVLITFSKSIDKG